jgi:branched-chain amino acid transport system permease protein
VVTKTIVSSWIARWSLVLGLIFVAIISFMPEGLVPGSVRLWRAGLKSLLLRTRGTAPVDIAEPQR